MTKGALIILKFQKFILAGVLLAAGAGIGIAMPRAQQDEHLGYQDTPLLPGGKWHVHDGLRRQPTIIDPGTASVNEAPGKAPSDANILFDGKDLSHWKSDKGDAMWKVENGELIIKPGAGSIHTTDQIGDCQLHIEMDGACGDQRFRTGAGQLRSHLLQQV